VILDRFVTAHQEELCSLTEALVAFETPCPPTRMSPSVCDAGWLAERGIPVVVYGPGGWEQAHAVDEAVATEDLLACARVYARVIGEWCER
jgi:acetylornithine deacetylase/succinyl-diaminopimelate desuccinylase-like protein